MKIAITGGTGFVGRHLARTLAAEGHHVVLVARGDDQRDERVRHLDRATFFAAGVDDEAQLRRAFAGCAAVAHCAGINRESGEQTYRRVHVRGTEAVVGAARAAGVGRLALLSFLRARPGCGSPYHESKWAAEEIVRSSGINHTIVKAGVIYGLGDHLLDHLSRALRVLPVFAAVGLREKTVRPVAVEDVVRVLKAALVEGRLPRRTVAVTGPEEMPLSEVVRRVARSIGRRVLVLPLPVAIHYALAWAAERVVSRPLVSVAQVRMLAEGIVTPLPACDGLPDDLQPQTRMTEAHILKGIPE